MELMGLKQAAHHKLLIQALQGTAEGKIDCLAARLSQSNPRLDIFLAWYGSTPPATASRARETSWPPATRPSSPAFGRGYCSAATLNPASPALHATLTLASKGRLIR